MLFVRFLAVGLMFGVSGYALAADTEPDAVDRVFWPPDETHCRFVKSGASKPEDDKGENWRYLFVTELVSDDISSTERGYMRLDGLLRELAFSRRIETKKGEIRYYETLGEPTINVEVDMRAGEARKSKLGQKVFFEYTGIVSVISGHSQRLVPFTGSCGVEPEKLK